MSLELYGRATSYNVQKVLWFLDELNLQYKHIECGGEYGGLESKEFGVLNPLRKVPVLVDNGASIRESNTILRFLAASYGGDLWWSESPIERAEYEKWMDWSIDKFESSFTGVFWGYYRTPKSRRNFETINKHIKAYVSCLSFLDKQLEKNRYVSGVNISLSDITLGVFIYRLQDIGLEIPLGPNISRWYAQLRTRKAFCTWVLSDFSQLKGREDY